LLPLDRYLLLLLHRLINIDSLGDLNCLVLYVRDDRVEIYVVRIIVEVPRLLLVVEHEFKVIATLASVLGKAEGVRWPSLS
jgi:hypothetical protein